MRDFNKFELGNIKLLSGKILKSARLVYKTYGTLNKKKSNVVLLPTFYTGTHIRNEGFIGKNRVLNPNKYFIISINMFGNGLSSSPSNSKKNQQGSKFPTVTLWDNINCQHKLIAEKLKIKKIALVTGWSMAGCQSINGLSTNTETQLTVWHHLRHQFTSCFRGVKSALTADKIDLQLQKTTISWFKAFGRVYVGWAFQDFYEKTLKIGYKDMSLPNWENDHAKNWDANDLLSNKT